MNFIKDVVKYSISNWVNFFLGFLAAVVLTRVMSTSLYGAYAIFNTTVTTLLMFFYFGLDQSFIRFYNEPPEGNTSGQMGVKLLRISISVEIIAALIVCIFFREDVTQELIGTSNAVFCAMLFTSVFAQIVLRFFNINYRMGFKSRAFTIEAIAVQVISKFVVIVAILISPGLNSIFLTNGLGMLLLSLIYVVFEWKKFAGGKVDLNYRGYGPVMRFSLFTAPVPLAAVLNTFINQQIIAHMLGNGAVGIYASANYFYQILVAFQGGFNSYWAAYMYSNYRQEQKKIQKVHDFVMMGLILLFLMLICFKDIIYLIIGQDFYESKKFFSFVLLQGMMPFVLETTGYGVILEKKAHINLLCYLVSLGVDGVLAYLLCPCMGLSGVAIAAASGGIVLMCLRTIVSQRYYRSITSAIKTTAGVSLLVCIAVAEAMAVSNKMIIWIIFGIIFIMIYRYEMTEVWNIFKTVIRRQDRFRSGQ